MSQYFPKRVTFQAAHEVFAIRDKLEQIRNRPDNDAAMTAARIDRARQLADVAGERHRLTWALAVRKGFDPNNDDEVAESRDNMEQAQRWLDHLIRQQDLARAKSEEAQTIFDDPLRDLFGKAVAWERGMRDWRLEVVLDRWTWTWRKTQMPDLIITGF
jgi:hypothetical protein